MIVVVRGRCGLKTPTSSTGAFLVVVECLLLASFLLHADLTATATVDAPDVPAPLVATAGVQTEIDAFMEKVLARRETNWIELQDYVLDEKESLDVRGPGGVVLDGFHREFTWYVRDHVLVRSPVRYDGVTIGETERVEYERTWLRRVQRREEKRREEDPATTTPTGPFTNSRSLRREGFLRFEFDPGNYYFAGRETFSDQAVVRIEYYPTRMFDVIVRGDDEIDEAFNKTTLATLWIDPEEYQIVKYEFDNVGLEFLPFRWLVRVEDLKASMVMSQPFDGVWLPQEIGIHGTLALANGSYRVEYVREFFNYKQAEVAARIRGYRSPEEQSPGR